MNTKTSEPKKPLLQTLGEGILKAQQEIDELAVQLSLGKAEARDKFEEIKKEFNQKVNELKPLLKNTMNESMPVGLKLRLEELELQLKLGKAVSQESFALQREALITAIVALENEIIKALKEAEVSVYFHHEAEKFLLKLEILRLKFGIKKFEIKDAFRTRMTRASKAITKLTGNIKKIGSRSNKHADFKKEISIAYKHMKSAIKSL